MLPGLKAKLDELEVGEAPSEDAGLFGANIYPEEATLVLIPVPWDATASYGKGAAKAPAAIVKASHQLDLFDLDFGRPYRVGITMADTTPDFPYTRDTHAGTINLASAQINQWVYESSKAYLKRGKFVAVIGGDHSSPFGLFRALSEQHSDFGVLHIDAHHDLRPAYEGYEHSHASIMYNVLENFPQVTKFVAVGIRDFSQGEYAYAHASPKRIKTFYDRPMSERLLSGEAFLAIATDIIAALPQKVYISFDIDGLDPVLCPGTGTPVPGGLSFNQMALILTELVKSGRKIIGFDLCEVSPQDGDGEWNANVGARVLYKLCGALVKSNTLKEF